MNTFEDSIVRVSYTNQEWQLANKFIISLIRDIKNDVEIHDPQTLEDAFYYALLLKMYEKVVFTSKMKAQMSSNTYSHLNLNGPLLNLAFLFLITIWFILNLLLKLWER